MIEGARPSEWASARESTFGRASARRVGSNCARKGYGVSWNPESISGIQSLESACGFMGTRLRRAELRSAEGRRTSAPRAFNHQEAERNSALQQTTASALPTDAARPDPIGDVRMLWRNRAREGPTIRTALTMAARRARQPPPSIRQQESVVDNFAFKSLAVHLETFEH